MAACVQVRHPIRSPVPHISLSQCHSTSPPAACSIIFTQLRHTQLQHIHLILHQIQDAWHIIIMYYVAMVSPQPLDLRHCLHSSQTSTQIQVAALVFSAIDMQKIPELHYAECHQYERNGSSIHDFMHRRCPIRLWWLWYRSSKHALWCS